MIAIKCYKFEVKTDLEPAETEDLVRASKQGTILRIKVNGRVYGSGGFGSQRDLSALKLTAVVLSVGMVVGGIALFLVRRWNVKKDLKALPPSFHESLQAEHSVSSNLSGASQEMSGIRLLFAILSRQFQKRLPPSFCENIQSNDSEDVRPID